MHKKLNNYLYGLFVVKTFGKRDGSVIADWIYDFEHVFNERIVLIEKTLISEGFIFNETEISIKIT